MHVPVKVTREVYDIVMKTELNSDALANMKELAAKKHETQTKFDVTNEAQTSGSKGFRIIGIMRDVTNQKARPIGYVLYNDTKKEHSAYSAEQVKMILGMYSFVNAKLENDEIVITDGAETALLQFDAYRNPIGQPTVYVLDRTKETMHSGSQSRQQEVVTFINSRLEVQKLPASSLIAAKNEGKIVIANMKVVNSPDGGSFLEAKNVTTIPTYEKEIRPTTVKSDAAEEFRKQQLKIKNHASFAQRLVDVFSNCIIVKNSPDKSTTYGTHMRLPGISVLYRGLSFVGTKGLTAIITKEVIPALKLKNASFDFEEALAEVSSDMTKTGVVVSTAVLKEFFVGNSNIDDLLSDPAKTLLLRYLYAFRLVDGLYKTINIADLVRVYHAQHYDYKEPYIVDSEYLVAKVYEKMLDSGRYGRMPSYQEFRRVIGHFTLDKDEVAPAMICRGITSFYNHTMYWPLPFKQNTDLIMKQLFCLPDSCKKFVPLLYHISSEASLLDNSNPTEYSYRLQRVMVMLTAFVTACYIETKEDSSQFYSIERVTFECIDACTNVRIYDQMNFARLYQNIKKQLACVAHSKRGDRDYLETLIKDYVRGGGLYFPYYSAMNTSVPTDTMYWAFLFPSLKNRRHVKLFGAYTKAYGANQLTLKGIQKKHKYGMCDFIDKVLRGNGIDIKYDVTPSFRHYERIQKHLEELDKTGKYTPISACFSRAAVAQYLGRPYRSTKSNYYHARTTRLVYYVNTPATRYRSKTHELY